MQDTSLAVYFKGLASDGRAIRHPARFNGCTRLHMFSAEIAMSLAKMGAVDLILPQVLNQCHSALQAKDLSTGEQPLSCRRAAHLTYMLNSQKGPAQPFVAFVSFIDGPRLLKPLSSINLDGLYLISNIFLM